MPIETADEALDMNNLTDDRKGGRGPLAALRRPAKTLSSKTLSSKTLAAAYDRAVLSFLSKHQSQ
jgi:hypothetical protein